MSAEEINVLRLRSVKPTCAEKPDVTLPIHESNMDYTRVFLTGILFLLVLNMLWVYRFSLFSFVIDASGLRESEPVLVLSLRLQSATTKLGVGDIYIPLESIMNSLRNTSLPVIDAI
jgi:hypothetical protein